MSGRVLIVGGTSAIARAAARVWAEKGSDVVLAGRDVEELERTLLERVNALGIGPQGFGGLVTALGVNVEVAPTHIAGLPVAVNLGCHSTRRASVTL